MTKDNYDIPLKPPSKIVDHSAGKNDTHELNDENIKAIEQNPKTPKPQNP